MDTQQIITLIIFIITYTGIIFTRLPWINIDRPSAAFFGAIAMIAFGILTFENAIMAIDFNTIALLLGMMIIISSLKLDGFFTLIAHKMVYYADNQKKLLFNIVIITGVASAFMVNDVVVILFTPVIIAICRSSRLNPVPFLIAEILSSNAGSVMTITGNPQNMLIGISSGISYSSFLLYLLPVAFLSLFVIYKTIILCYPEAFNLKIKVVQMDGSESYQLSDMFLSLVIFSGVILLFFFAHLFNISIPLIALAGASLVLLFGRIKPSAVIREIDWVLLLFFASLFIVVNAVEKTGLITFFLQGNLFHENLQGLLSIHGISLLLSQVVSNVPFTIALLPVMKSISSDMLWISLASAATLAGNATIIGAIANLIVIGSAEKDGVKISFKDFLKPGLAVTLITLVISVMVIGGYYFLGWI